MKSSTHLNNEELVPENKFKITIEDLHTKNLITVFVDTYSDDPESIEISGFSAFNDAFKKLVKGENMNDPRTPELDQDQDLNHHKTEESDNLQKSADPDAEYMKDRGLDRETHGK